MSLSILLIAYRFPPQVGGGVYRPHKLASLWAKAGHRVSVLTVSADPDETRDEPLAAELPPEVTVRVVHDPSLHLFLGRMGRRLPDLGRAAAVGQRVALAASVPDKHGGWIPAAARAGSQLARAANTDVIVASGPPFSTFIAGSFIARSIRRPLVLDYRDAWMGYYLQSRRTAAQRWVNPSLETWALKRASGVIAAHRSVLRDLPAVSRTMPRLFAPNGFDPADFAEPIAGPSTDRFTLTYSGSLTAGRNPGPFLEVLDRLLAAGTLDPDRVRLTMFGDQTDRIRELTSSLSSVRQVLNAPGHVSHRDSVRAVRESTVNLIFVRDMDERNRHSPGKFYELLYAERPLLVVAPEGVTTRLARRAGGCSIIHPQDADGIERALRRLYTAWAAGEPIELPRRDRVAFYSRPHQARRIVGFLDRIVEQGRLGK